MKKKIVTLCLVIALVATMVAGGTLAYFTDTDEAVNVMTLGNVKIEQLEYERVVDANGNWVTSTTADRYGYYPDELQPFTQDKPLFPSVWADGIIKWDDRNGSQEASGAGSHQQSWAQVGASGSNQLFDSSVKNVIDKFVFVENTGASDAYVRTWIALEQGSVAADDFENVIMLNSNKNHWESETVASDVVIGDSEYIILCYTYKGPSSNPNGVLAPGKVSYPSLLQVYMRPWATNEDAAAIDGNGNGLYEILVFSQAVQTAGFDNAKAALDEAFGTAHPWTNAVNSSPSTDDELEDSLKDPNASTIIINLTADATYDTGAWANDAMGGEATKRVIINGNGHTLTFNHTNNDWNNITTNGATLVLNDVHLTNTGKNDGPWNRHDLNFGCDVELNNVTSDKAMAFKADAKLNNVKIVDNSGDIYAIWIQPNGQKVSIDGLTVEGARGIKIDEQYVSSPAAVDLTVKNATFKTTGSKAAILVKCAAGANITVSNVDITDCAADSTNAVWVDDAAAASDPLVIVTGATKILEP